MGACTHIKENILGGEKKEDWQNGIQIETAT